MIYVPRQQKLNKKKAAKFGDIHALTDKNDTNYGLEPDRIKIQLDLLKDFDPGKDKLLLDGQLVYNVVAAGIITKNRDNFKAIIWKRGKYEEVEINVKAEGENDEDAQPSVWATNEAHVINEDVRYMIRKDDRVNSYSPEDIYSTAKDRIAEFNDKDRLILTGSLLMNVIVAVNLLKIHGYKIKLQLMDHRVDEYVTRNLNLTDI